MPRTARRYAAGPDDDGRRLDRIVRAMFPDLPLSGIYRMFRSGDVRLNGVRARGEARVSAGDEVELRLLSADPPDAPPPDAPVEAPPAGPPGGRPRPESGSLHGNGGDAGRAFAAMILVETPEIAVVNKPRGMLSHGPGGVEELAAAYFSGRSAASLAFRPAPLHRLDRNTSGALVVSASIRGARAFSDALRRRAVAKEYLALLDGELAEAQDWEDLIARDSASGVSAVIAEGGTEARLARLRVEPLSAAGGRTLVLVRLYTGLTHQIRAQCAARGHALSGDLKYGGRPFRDGYTLHCARLGFPAGLGAGFPASVVAPLPGRAAACLDAALGPAWRIPAAEYS